jgi:hypothetical protein
MEAIKQAFYEVMCKYEKHFSAYGVCKNLRAWEKAKSPLLSLLRRHPNWDEDALAVVFGVTEKRETDSHAVNEKRLRLIALTEALTLTDEQRRRFQIAMELTTRDCSPALSDYIAGQLQNHCDVKCVAGQKTSRVINKLCRHCGVDTLPEYNAVFAQLSDALNPLEVSKKALLSLHPCDYLEMSSKSSSWSSCHGLQRGGWQAGCLSYMTDSSSMIFYTVDDDTTSEYYKAPRLSRQVFCYGDGTLLQSRLYPNSDDSDANHRYRSLVQGTLAACLDIPDRWIIRKNMAQYLHTEDGSRHYRDYDSYGCVTTLKETGPYTTISIGSKVICVCCGGAVNENNSLKCGCTPQVVCMDCGASVPENAARYHEDGRWHCSQCLHFCPLCGQAARTDFFPAFDAHGLVLHICADCHTAITAVCGDCTAAEVCGTVGGNRLCARASATAAHIAVPLRRAA